MRCIRQGDVIFIPVKIKPENDTRHEQLTVALGEATGHHHTLYGIHPGATIHEWNKDSKRFIKLDKEFSLKHQEHHEIIVPPGTYEIGMEQEYDPFTNVLKKVVD
jgi:hypothetical protein